MVLNDTLRFIVVLVHLTVRPATGSRMMKHWGSTKNEEKRTPFALLLSSLFLLLVAHEPPPPPPTTTNHEHKTGVVIFLWWLMTCFVTFLLNDPSAVMLLWPWQNKKSESIFQPRARRSSSFMRDRGDEIRIRCCCEDHNNYDTTYSSFIIHHSSYDTS